MEKVIEVIRKINTESNLTYNIHSIDRNSHKPYTRTESINDLYVDYEPPLHKKKRLRFLENVTNRDGSFRTLSNLVSAGTISEQELKYYPEERLPRRVVNQIHRIKTQAGKEYIVRVEQWKGIGKSGSIITCPVTLGTYVEPFYTTEFQPVDRNDPTGPTVRVARLGLPQAATYVGTKKYTDEYAPEKIRKYLKHVEGVHNKDWSTLLIKEGEPNPIAIKDTTRFATEDFDTLWTEFSRARPQVDIKDLVRELRNSDKNTEHEVYG
jgi:hypothetical protein